MFPVKECSPEIIFLFKMPFVRIPDLLVNSMYISHMQFIQLRVDIPLFPLLMKAWRFREVTYLPQYNTVYEDTRI